MARVYSGDTFKNIGGGILYSSNIIGDDELNVDGYDRFKFLNHLWLPVRTNELSAEQIIIINKFRVERYRDDQQFRLHENYARSIAAYIEMQGYRSIIELGCGAFPIVEKISYECNYLGVDLDPNCIEMNKKNGIRSLLNSEFINTEISDDFDVMVALFVLQFDISDEILRKMSSLVKYGAIICNIISKDNAIKIGMMRRIMACGFILGELESPMGTDSHDILIVGYKRND